MICSLIFCFVPTIVFPFDAFTPPVDVTESVMDTNEQTIEIKPVQDINDNLTPKDEQTIPEENIASNVIYLDITQVNQALLNGLLPSPSEYKKGNIPSINLPSELKQKDEYLKTKPENEFSFTDIEGFVMPSEYKKTVKPQKEISPSYYASAQTDDNIPNLEGKIIQGISVNGLKLLDEKDVLSVVFTKNGSEFHSYMLQKDLQSIYNLGYFSDLMDVEPTYNESNDTVSLTFNLKENPEIKDIVIKGNTVISTEELMKFTKDLKNLPQNLITINDSIKKINDYYAQKGYILGNVSNIDDSKDGIVTFEISEGVIEKIIFDGEHKTKDYVIERNMITSAGSVYNEEILKKDISRIYATQIFDTIDRTIEPSTTKDGEYVVKIAVKEASSNSISIGAGVDNALGVFGSISILEKNFMGKGQQLGITGMVGSGVLLSDASIKNHMNYQLELFFKEPHFINADNSLMSKLYVRELGSYQVPLAIERRFGINGVITHKVKGNDKLLTSLGLGYEHIHLSETEYNKIYNMYKLRNIDFSKRSKQLIGGNFINISPSVEYTDVDNDFMPRKGIVAKASFIESFCVDHLKRTNGRIMAKITKYIPVFKKSTLALTAKTGIKVHGGNHMPEVMTFGLGGPYTVRGFRMSGVGTGDSFLMGSAELQTPIPFMDKFKYEVLKNLRFAFFIDAGKIYNPTISSSLYDRPNSAISVGVGLRINIPGIGPISIDYGLPLTHVGQYNSKRGYFTFGTGGLYDSY